MSLTVRYIDTPVGAQESAQVSGNEIQPCGSYSDVTAGVPDIPWATLEPGLWTLDGTRKILADNAKHTGWWSKSKSGDDGSFSTPPTIEIAFAEPYTTTALTFTFWPSTDQWCTGLNVAWYKGDALLAETATYPDGPQWELEQVVESFDRIVIQILSINKGNQFAKIQKIQIGKVYSFGRNEIITVRLLNEVDPSLCELSIDTLRIEIQNRNGRLLIPQENQQMEVYRNDNLLAVQYIQESSREATHYYTFSCQSAIGLLGNDYLGGIYVDVPVETVLDEIMDDRKYVLDGVFHDQTVTGYLPICSRRDALQQVAFALGAMVTSHGSDAIMLIPVPTAKTSSFDGSTIFPGAKATNAPRIAKVVLVSHSYTPTAEVKKLLDEEKIDGSDVLVTFDEPYHAYAITGGVISGSGANWVTITAHGPVSLTGKTYLHSMMHNTRRNPEALASERSNILTVDEATLVHSGNAQAVLDRLYEAKLLRQTLSHDAIISGQFAGQRVHSVNPWGTYTQGYIKSMESTLTQGGHTAQVEILGTAVTEEELE